MVESLCLNVATGSECDGSAFVDTPDFRCLSFAQTDGDCEKAAARQTLEEEGESTCGQSLSENPFSLVLHVLKNRTIEKKTKSI